MEWENRYYRQVSEQDFTRIGLEQMLGSIVALRAGISGTDLNDKQNTTFSAGLGFTTSGIGVSITAEDYKLNLEDVYRYIISANFAI